MTAPAPLSRRGRRTLAAIGLAVLALVVVANGHLLYVALASEPGCVPHLKAPEPGGTAFRAARSSC